MSKWIVAIVGGGIAILGGYALYQKLKDEKQPLIPPLVPPTWIEPEETIRETIPATGVTTEYSTFGETIEIPESGRKGDRIIRIIPPDPKTPPPENTYRVPIPGVIPGLPPVGYYEIDIEEEKVEPKTRVVEEPKPTVTPRTSEEIRLLR